MLINPVLGKSKRLATIRHKFNKNYSLHLKNHNMSKVLRFYDEENKSDLIALASTSKTCFAERAQEPLYIMDHKDHSMSNDDCRDIFNKTLTKLHNHIRETLNTQYYYFMLLNNYENED